jgi:hypothetical protein
MQDEVNAAPTPHKRVPAHDCQFIEHAILVGLQRVRLQQLGRQWPAHGMPKTYADTINADLGRRGNDLIVFAMHHQDRPGVSLPCELARPLIMEIISFTMICPSAGTDLDVGCCLRGPRRTNSV